MPMIPEGLPQVPSLSNALEFLLALAEKIKRGDMNVLNFYVNPSVSDPCNMQINITTCRGSAEATGIPSVEYATATGKEVIDRTTVKKYMAAFEREQEREKRERNMARNLGARGATSAVGATGWTRFSTAPPPGEIRWLTFQDKEYLDEGIIIWTRTDIDGRMDRGHCTATRLSRRSPSQRNF